MIFHIKKKHICTVCDIEIPNDDTKCNYGLKICSGKCLAELDKKMAQDNKFKMHKGHCGWDNHSSLTRIELLQYRRYFDLKNTTKQPDGPYRIMDYESLIRIPNGKVKAFFQLEPDKYRVWFDEPN